MNIAREKEKKKKRSYFIQNIEFLLKNCEKKKEKKN